MANPNGYDKVPMPESESKTRTSHRPEVPTSSGVNVGAIGAVPGMGIGKGTGIGGKVPPQASKAGPGGSADNRARPTDTGKNPRRVGSPTAGKNSSRHVPGGARQPGGGYGAS